MHLDRESLQSASRQPEKVWRSQHSFFKTYSDRPPSGRHRSHQTKPEPLLQRKALRHSAIAVSMQTIIAFPHLPAVSWDTPEGGPIQAEHVELARLQ